MLGICFAIDAQEMQKLCLVVLYMFITDLDIFVRNKKDVYTKHALYQLLEKITKK